MTAMIDVWALTVLKLLVAHALCDFPLQGDFLARGKNHKDPAFAGIWPIALAAHAAIHGGAVAFVTGIPALGICEAAMHARIDYAKCSGRISFEFDQAAHVLCKAAWAFTFACVEAS